MREHTVIYERSAERTLGRYERREEVTDRDEDSDSEAREEQAGFQVVGRLDPGNGFVRTSAHGGSVDVGAGGNRESHSSGETKGNRKNEF